MKSPLRNPAFQAGLRAFTSTQGPCVRQCSNRLRSAARSGRDIRAELKDSPHRWPLRVYRSPAPSAHRRRCSFRFPLRGVAPALGIADAEEGRDVWDVRDAVGCRRGRHRLGLGGPQRGVLGGRRRELIPPGDPIVAGLPGIEVEIWAGDETLDAVMGLGGLGRMRTAPGEDDLVDCAIDPGRLAPRREQAEFGIAPGPVQDRARRARPRS
jgi:hypothetical protein